MPEPGLSALNHPQGNSQVRGNTRWKHRLCDCALCHKDSGGSSTEREDPWHCPGKAPKASRHRGARRVREKRGTKPSGYGQGDTDRRVCKPRFTQHGTGHPPPCSSWQALLWSTGWSWGCSCSGHDGCTPGRQQQHLPSPLQPRSTAGPARPCHRVPEHHRPSPCPRALRSHPEERGHGSTAGMAGTSRRRLSTAPARESSCTLPLLSSFCVPEISSSPGQIHM